MAAVLVLLRGSKPCERLRDYLDEHSDIKKSVTVVLFRESELNEKTVADLKERGFERFPTLVIGDGTKIVGVEAIIDRLRSAHEFVTDVKKLI